MLVHWEERRLHGTVRVGPVGGLETARDNACWFTGRGGTVRVGLVGGMEIAWNNLD